MIFNPWLGADKSVNIFSKDISPKVNVIAQLKFNLIYFVARVQHFSHYALVTFRPMYE